MRNRSAARARKRFRVMLAIALACAVLGCSVAGAQTGASQPAPAVPSSGAVSLTPQPTSATGTVPPAQNAITNYWELLRDLTARMESAPPRGRSIGRGLDTPTMEYPFDALRNLRVTHLIRAALEGAAEARKRCEGRSEAECDQLARANVVKCLDYVPLLSQDPAEGLELFTLLQKKETDRALRIYILDALAPDAPRELLLAAWLDRVRNRYEQDYRKTLDLLAGASRDDPEVQLRALDRCFEWYFKGYKNAWESDSKVRAAAEAGQHIDMAAMLSAQLPEVDSITLKTLREQGAVVSRYADTVAPHIDPLSQRDPRIKEKVRAQLTFIVESVLVPDRDKIRKYLDPAYEPPAPSPQRGAMPGGMVVIPVGPGGSLPAMPFPPVPAAPGAPAASDAAGENVPPPVDSPFGVPLVEPRPAN